MDLIGAERGDMFPCLIFTSMYNQDDTTQVFLFSLTGVDLDS